MASFHAPQFLQRRHGYWLAFRPAGRPWSFYICVPGYRKLRPFVLIPQISLSLTHTRTHKHTHTHTPTHTWLWRTHAHTLTHTQTHRTHTHTHNDDDEVLLNVLRCQLTLGTSWDQCRGTVQYSFTSTETRRLVRADSPGRPPRLSPSQLLNYDTHTMRYMYLYTLGVKRVHTHTAAPPPSPPPPLPQPPTHTHHSWIHRRNNPGQPWL